MLLRAWLCRQSWPIPPGAKVFWWHGVSFGRFHATLVTVTTGSLLQWDPSWWSKLLASDFGYRVPRVQLQIAIVASFDFQTFQIRIRQCQSSEQCFPGIFDELMEIQTTRWPRNCCQGGLEWTERPWGQGKAFSIWGSRSLIDLVVIRFESLDPCDMFSEFPAFWFWPSPGPVNASHVLTVKDTRFEGEIPSSVLKLPKNSGYQLGGPSSKDFKGDTGRNESMKDEIGRCQWRAVVAGNWKRMSFQCHVTFKFSFTVDLYWICSGGGLKFWRLPKYPTKNASFYAGKSLPDFRTQVCDIDSRTWWRQVLK